MALGEENPVYGPFFGVMGAAAAIIFSGRYRFEVDSLTTYNSLPLIRPLSETTERRRFASVSKPEKRLSIDLILSRPANF